MKELGNLKKMIKKVSKVRKESKLGFISVNTRLLEILEIGKKRLKSEVREEILELRLIEMNVYGDKDEDFKIVESVEKTIYNGMNSSVANSNNGSSFNYSFGNENGVKLCKSDNSNEIWIEKL